MLCFTWSIHIYCEANPPLPPIADHCSSQPPLGETEEEPLGWGHWPSLLRNSPPDSLKTASAWQSYRSRNIITATHLSHTSLVAQGLLDSRFYKNCTFTWERSWDSSQLLAAQSCKRACSRKGLFISTPPPPILHPGFLPAVSIDRPRPGQL